MNTWEGEEERERERERQRQRQRQRKGKERQRKGKGERRRSVKGNQVVKGVRLDEFSNVHGHFIDLGGVVKLNIAEKTDFLVRHEVNRHSFSPVSS